MPCLYLVSRPTVTLQLQSIVGRVPVAQQPTVQNIFQLRIRNVAPAEFVILNS
jgi:hypothetical protein